MSVTNVIEVKDLCKRPIADYPEMLGLRKVNLNIKKNEFVVIEQGQYADASCLLSLIGFSKSKYKGKILYNGTEVIKHSEKEMNKILKDEIFSIYPSGNLIEELSVYENIELPLRYKTKLSKRERKSVINPLISHLGLLEYKNTQCKHLVTFDRVKAVIARVGVYKPKLLLIDNFLNNMDPLYMKLTMDLLASLNRSGITIIMTSSQCLGESWANRSVTMIDGTIKTSVPGVKDSEKNCDSLNTYLSYLYDYGKVDG